MNSRIDLGDSAATMISRLAEGNSGAAITLMNLLRLDEGIDPDSVWGPLSSIVSLDSHQIYGTDIYILANDQCDGNSHKLILLLRATQMGIFPANKLKRLSADQMRSEKITEEEWDNMVRELKVKLPNFDVKY